MLPVVPRHEARVDLSMATELIWIKLRSAVVRASCPLWVVVSTVKSRHSAQPCPRSALPLIADIAIARAYGC
jgi:hypothetical protein